MSELALKLIAENKAKHAQGEDARSLDLGNCGLTEVPEEVGELVWLEKLDLSKNEKLFNLSPVSKLQQLEQLYFYETGIGDLSPIARLKYLKCLYLDSTRVSDLSPISSHFNLIKLFFHNTIISDLTPISGLYGLNILEFHFTKVIDLLPISGLVNLEVLYCNNTDVDNLWAISKFEKLKVLYCNDTNISDLSPLRKLNNLQILYCQNTSVSDLSPLLNLTSIQRIYFNNTRISNLHPIIGAIEKFCMMQWHDCPLVSPPPEIIQKGHFAILNYFEELEKQQFKNTEIKLILVGNSTAGKTSLSQYLQNRTFTKAQSTTHGIQNQQWQPKEREIQVNLWDFGGQEYYHATHRLFLSRNAVYVLVWDAQTDKGGIEPTEIHYPNDTQSCMVDIEHFPQKWWLQNIRHYTRESNPPVPVLLVQNKCARDGQQRVSGEFEKPPFNLMPEWLDNHIDLEATADPEHPQHKKWLRQFEAFEEHLLDKLQSQLAHYEFAVYHRDIRDKVRELAAGGMNDMSYIDFEALCRNIEADASMDLVQIYLRDITGDILYYPNNERLRKRVFLRPDWACNQIYAILSRKVLEKQGFFDLDWVRESLGESVADTTTTADEFVELLHEFELVFPESDDNGLPTGQLVAPQYLPDTCTKPDKLEAAKEYANLSHAFTLWFPEFLPKSHIARFVAHWGSQAKQRLFWKNGLLFQTDGCTALVERIGEDKIRVELQNGETIKREAAMQRIFQSFYHLEDGQAVFAISLDTMHFVWWRDVEEAIQGQAQQVKSFYSGNNINFIDLQPFFIFTKRYPLKKRG